MAHARELPPSLSGKDDRSRSQGDKIPLPADYQFPPNAVAAAKAAPQDLSEADIARALTRFRGKAGESLSTPAKWAERGAAYLAVVKAKPVDLNEDVWVGDSMFGAQLRPLRLLGPGIPYTRVNGDKGRTPGKAASMSII